MFASSGMGSQAYQGVVLCGGLGNRMKSLTDHIPKCMLPIGDIPMFWYPLNFLQRNSIRGSHFKSLHFGLKVMCILL